MITIQVHRNTGADEDFEAETVHEASSTARAFYSDPDVRRVVILDEETGRTLDEWVKS